MEYQDYYKVLGVPHDASTKDIKSAYRKLTKKYHPDVNKGDSQAEAKYRQINEAYEVLGDSEKRAKYDQFGSQWDKYQHVGGNPFGGGGHAQSINLEDLLSQFGGGFSSGGRSGRSAFFDMLFGNMGGGFANSGGAESFMNGSFAGGSPFSGRNAHGAGKRGKDLEGTTTISIAEAYKGVARTITIERLSDCTVCGGKGVNNNRACAVCQGTGHVRTPRQIKVKIPAGVASGTKMRVRGEGEPGQFGGANGDLFLQVNIVNDSVFSLKGKDVECELWISMFDAIFGNSVDFTVPDGSQLSLRIKEGTQNGTRLKLSGRGLPNTSGAGDLYVRLMVKLPLSLSEEQRRLFKQLDDR